MSLNSWLYFSFFLNNSFRLNRLLEHGLPSESIKRAGVYAYKTAQRLHPIKERSIHHINFDQKKINYQQDEEWLPIKIGNMKILILIYLISLIISNLIFFCEILAYLYYESCSINLVDDNPVDESVTNLKAFKYRI